MDEQQGFKVGDQVRFRTGSGANIGTVYEVSNMNGETVYSVRSERKQGKYISYYATFVGTVAELALEPAEPDATARLRQQNEALKAALKPFAQTYQWDNMDLLPDDNPVYAAVEFPDDVRLGTPVLYVKYFKAAAAALGTAGEEG